MRSDQPVLSAATVKPEDVRHFEVRRQDRAVPRLTANVSVFDTEIEDFQAQVVNAGVGVLRGYLANAEKVRVRGVEFDGSAALRSATCRSTLAARTPTASTSRSRTRRRRSRTPAVRR